ncbi:hypothetical protein MRX96_005220 [Rhipicephalus microplus]
MLAISGWFFCPAWSFLISPWWQRRLGFCFQAPLVETAFLEPRTCVPSRWPSGLVKPRCRAGADGRRRRSGLGRDLASRDHGVLGRPQRGTRGRATPLLPGQAIDVLLPRFGWF